MSQGSIMAIEQFDAAIKWQADHAEEAGAPRTARIVRALAKVRESKTRVGHKMRNWPGLTLKDAMPLRIAGGLHFLQLCGADGRLAPVYAGEIIDQGAVDALVLQCVAAHDAALVPWLDGPPQTNEAGRSASIMAGLLWLAQRVTPRFELFEIGASAGVNTMMDRYRYGLGRTEVGPTEAPMRIEPQWRGNGAPPPAPCGFAIASVKGCDVAPIDLSDPDAAMRLKAYVWPDARARMERIDAAIALASERAPNLVKRDAADFVAEMLEREQLKGTTRALFHSIMWQYMPVPTQDRITALMEQAGARASPERPVAWISLETDPETFRHELTVRHWNGKNGDGRTVKLAHAHPHGAWVEWLPH